MNPLFKEWYEIHLEQEVTSVLCELPFDQSTIERWLEQAWEEGNENGYNECLTEYGHRF